MTEDEIKKDALDIAHTHLLYEKRINIVYEAVVEVREIDLYTLILFCVLHLREKFYHAKMAHFVLECNKEEDYPSYHVILGQLVNHR